MSKSNLLLEVITDLRKLADSLQAVMDSFPDSEPEPVQPEHTNVKRTDANTVKLEQVRMVLAEKSQDGFTAEVRAVLEKHGASRLSEIDPANYAALLADAERLK